MHNIDIKLKPSKVFIFLVVLALAGSIAIIYSLPILARIKAILLSLTLIYGWYLLWDRALMQGAYAVLGLKYSPAGWEVRDRVRESTAELCGESTITAVLSVLRFRLEGQKRKRSCVVFRDALSRDLYRQLLVTLRTTEIKK